MAILRKEKKPINMSEEAIDISIGELKSLLRKTSEIVETCNEEFIEESEFIERLIILESSIALTIARLPKGWDTSDDYILHLEYTPKKVVDCETEAIVAYLILDFGGIEVFDSMLNKIIDKLERRRSNVFGIANLSGYGS